MKITQGIFVGISIVCAFSLGRIITQPEPFKPSTTHEETKNDWFDALPDVPQSLTEPVPTKQERSEMILRAYYLNQQREQFIRREAQWMQAELEARRMNNRIGEYDPNRWRYHSYWER